MDDLKRFKLEEQKRKFKEKAEDAKAKISCFWANNKDAIVVMTPFVATGVAGLAKAGASIYRTKSENFHRDREVYDPRSGDYYTLKRKMTNQQKLELERRMARGERKGDILRSMKLI